MRTNDRTLTNGRYTPPTNYASGAVRRPVGGLCHEEIDYNRPLTGERALRRLNEQVREATHHG